MRYSSSGAMRSSSARWPSADGLSRREAVPRRRRPRRASHPIYTVSVDEKPGVQALRTAPIRRRSPACTPAWDVTTNTCATAPCRSSRRWTCTAARSSPRRAAPSQPRVHRPARTPAYALPERGRHPCRAGQPQCPHLQGDDGLLGEPPGRFGTCTPKHGSWPISSSRPSRRWHDVPRHIRSPLEELEQRILKGIDEMNAQPVRFQWKSSTFK